MVQAEWVKGLEGLTGQEIAEGLSHVRANNTWPPSIAEFRTACRGGANAEQRAYAAKSRDYSPAIKRGTHGDVAEVVAEHVESVKAKLDSKPAYRSVTDIASGKWTREMEANFQHHASLLGRREKAIEWPGVNDGL